MTESAFGLRAFLLALAVVAVWGTNFVVIRIGLDSLPPLLFAALRFTLVIVPALLFIKRPAVPWKDLAAFGIFIGVGQFGLLFIAIDGFIAPGLASLVVQTQVVFTIAFVMRGTGERLVPAQYVALALAVAGIAIIFTHVGGTNTPLGVALVLGASLSWSLGNMVQRRVGRIDMLAFVIWSSAFAVPPLFALALLFEGPDRIVTAVAGATPIVWAAVAWQAVGNTMFGYGAWGWLLARYPAASVAPMALLVPVFGMGSAALWLGEPLPAWKLLAAALIIGGLAVNLFGPRLLARRVPPVAGA
ncbi:membrane protein [Polymorphobacter glacialis]|uniref:Membrane protein n=1 Tax=Sandarakinorhabdus glacialis TaxID=1614636 RepID=A0A917A0Y6_9SPHN|nr:EamA family transporter [Polymorphobacter glacialis]GGE20409.1 membrane protein [Polymorphobacter glacialis]